LLEAAGCGLPSVSTRLGGVVDFVEDGVNGLLVSPNFEEIAKGIERLLTDNELRKELGKTARQRFVEAFDMHIVAQHLAELYKSLRDELAFLIIERKSLPKINPVDKVSEHASLAL